MASEAERRPLRVFECQLCGLTAPYSYVGQKPPDTQSVVLLEQSYVMKDPFSPDRGRFLVLGAQCSVCGRLVCVGPVGMQSVLLQEVLSPLRPGEPRRLPAGNPAGPGEEEGSLHAALRPDLSCDLSAV
ncbi:cysteine-rich DPF motif domain-containing protein 1 isoform 1-T6 [Erethizon dorsatum]